MIRPTILVWLLLFTSGCAGSPRITIIKNVYIYKSDFVSVTYRTESSTESLAEIDQALEGTVKPK